MILCKINQKLMFFDEPRQRLSIFSPFGAGPGGDYPLKSRKAFCPQPGGGLRALQRRKLNGI